MTRLGIARAAILCLSIARTAHAQTPVDSALLAYINGIRAIDVHAHPMRPVASGAPADTEFDALPLDGIPPFPVPTRLGPDDRVWRTAQDALFHAPGAANDSLYRVGLRAAVEATETPARRSAFQRGRSTKRASTSCWRTASRWARGSIRRGSVGSRSLTR